MERLRKKVAIVTGAGQGIGLAIADRFSSEGARVVIAERNPESGSAAARDLKGKTGNDTLFVETDVADGDAIQEMLRRTHAAFGAVDILVNNAGIAVCLNPLEVTKDDWDRCMAVDLEGAWLCCKAVLPEMLERRYGAIINIASVHGSSVMRSAFPYPVAKHGILGLTRALALQYADKGIAVNAISPGFIDTPIADWCFGRAVDPIAAREVERKKQPIQRFGLPSEVAAVAALMASDEARFMVGANVVIDGGVSVRLYD